MQSLHVLYQLHTVVTEVYTIVDIQGDYKIVPLDHIAAVSQTRYSQSSPIFLPPRVFSSTRAYKLIESHSAQFSMYVGCGV